VLFLVSSAAEASFMAGPLFSQGFNHSSSQPPIIYWSYIKLDVVSAGTLPVLLQQAGRYHFCCIHADCSGQRSCCTV